MLWTTVASLQSAFLENNALMKLPCCGMNGTRARYNEWIIKIHKADINAHSLAYV